MSRMWRMSVCFCLIVVGIGCSGDSSLKERYTAERMYWKANRLYENLMANPRMAKPTEYERAIDAFRVIVDMYAGRSLGTIKALCGQSRLAMARLYLRQDKFTDAIEEFRKILAEHRANPSLSAAAQLAIARCQESMGNLEEAIVEYRRLVDGYPPTLRSPDDPDVDILETPVRLARLYRQVQGEPRAEVEHRRAREYLREVISRWPGTLAAAVAQHQIATSYIDERKWEETVEALQRFVDEYSDNPGVPEILLTMGDIFEQGLNRPAEAQRVYRRILDDYPKETVSGQAYLAIGELLMRQGKLDQARREFQRVIDEYSKDGAVCAQAQFAIALTYEREGKWEKALSDYQWVIDNYPTTPQALEIPLYIADHDARHRRDGSTVIDYQRAIERYQQIIERYPNTPLAASAQSRIATCYARQERWEEAAEALHKLVNTYPPSPEVAASYLTLGALYEEKMKDRERARKVYLTMVEKFPRYPLASQAKERLDKLQGGEQ